jgi:hypothetical protein
LCKLRSIFMSMDGVIGKVFQTGLANRKVASET